MGKGFLAAAALGGCIALAGCGGDGGNNTAAGGAEVTTQLTLTNGSGKTILRLSARPRGTGSESWGRNLLPATAAIPPSGNLQFSFTHPAGQCRYDFLVDRDQAGTAEMLDRNICEQAELYHRDN